MPQKVIVCLLAMSYQQCEEIVGRSFSPVPVVDNDYKSEFGSPANRGGLCSDKILCNSYLLSYIVTVFGTSVYRLQYYHPCYKFGFLLTNLYSLLFYFSRIANTDILRKSKGLRYILHGDASALLVVSHYPSFRRPSSQYENLCRFSLPPPSLRLGTQNFKALRRRLHPVSVLL